MKFKSTLILICSLLLALPAWAQSALEGLLDQAERPTIAQVLEAKKSDGVRNGSNPYASAMIDPRVASIMETAPVMIAALEFAYPGAKLAFVGRDSAFLADIVEAYFLARGLKEKVVRLGISGGSIDERNKPLILDFLKNNGLTVGHDGRIKHPYIIVDATSWRGTSEQAASQARQLIEAVYSEFVSKEGPFLLDRINAVGQGPSSVTKEKSGGGFINGELITKDLSLMKFFGSLDVTRSGPSKILYLPGSFAYGEMDWHELFGKLERDSSTGKVSTKPGILKDRSMRESILASMITVADIVESPEFYQRVGSANSRFRPNIELKAKDNWVFANDDQFKNNLGRGDGSGHTWLERLESDSRRVPEPLKPLIVDRWVEALEQEFMRENPVLPSDTSEFYKSAGQFVRFISSDIHLLARGLHKLSRTQIVHYDGALWSINFNHWLTDALQNASDYQRWNEGTGRAMRDSPQPPNTVQFFERLFKRSHSRLAIHMHNAVYPAQAQADTVMESIRVLEEFRDSQVKSSEPLAASAMQKKKVAEDTVLTALRDTRGLEKHSEIFERFYRVASPVLTFEAILKIPTLAHHPRLIALVADYLRKNPLNASDKTYPQIYFDQFGQIDRIAGAIYYMEGIGNQPELNAAFEARGQEPFKIKVLAGHDLAQFPEFIEQCFEYLKTLTVSDNEIAKLFIGRMLAQAGMDVHKAKLDEIEARRKTIYDPRKLTTINEARVGDIVKISENVFVVKSITVSAPTKMDRLKAFAFRTDNNKFTVYILFDANGNESIYEISSNGMSSFIQKTTAVSLVPIETEGNTSDFNKDPVGAAHRCALEVTP